MAKAIKNTVRLGIFVTVSIALFTATVYYIGNRQNLFGAKYRISTHFNNVGGLQVGNNVRYAGINVGSVADIVFVNDSTLRVDMQLNDKVHNVIKKDATASIGSDGLVGNVIVNISPGNGNMPPAKNGDTIASYSRVGTEDILKTLGNTNESIAILALNLLEITDKLNNGQGTFPLLIRDSIMGSQVAQSFYNLRMTTEQLRLTSEQLRQSLDMAVQGEGMLGYLLKDTTLPHQLEGFVARFDTMLFKEVEPIFADLQKSGEDLATTSAQLKDAVAMLNSGDGLAHTILQDTAAAKDLKNILENVSEGTDRFNQNMEALKHNFFFRKYFKKLEKGKLKKGDP